MKIQFTACIKKNYQQIEKFIKKLTSSRLETFSSGTPSSTTIACSKVLSTLPNNSSKAVGSKRNLHGRSALNTPNKYYII